MEEKNEVLLGFDARQAWPCNVEAIGAVVSPREFRPTPHVRRERLRLTLPCERPAPRPGARCLSASRTQVGADVGEPVRAALRAAPVPGVREVLEAYLPAHLAA